MTLLNYLFMKLYYIFIYSITFAILSCSNTKSKIEDFTEVISNAEKNYSTFNETDWKELEELDKEFEQDLEVNSKDYSPEQRKNANKLIGKYTMLSIKRNINDFKKDLEDVGQQIEGMVESVDESTNN